MPFRWDYRIVTQTTLKCCGMVWLFMKLYIPGANIAKEKLTIGRRRYKIKLCLLETLTFRRPQTANRPSLNHYVFALLSLVARTTLANTEDEIQVYNDAINAPGKFGLEIQ